MSRTIDKILFKGIDKVTGREICGYLVKAKWYLDDSDRYLIVPEGYHVYPRNEIFYHEVDPDTIEVIVNDD